MSKFFLIIFILLLTGCAVSNNPLRKDVKKLQRGATREDTSYAYSLPFEEGTSHLLTQAYFGSFTHKERIALDFSMKKGTKICAARDGVVVRLKEDSDRGGWNKKY
jgi:hypothetical protein